MPSIDALPTLNRASPTFKADCNAFFGTKIPAFSAQAEAARQQIVAAETASAASAAAAMSSQIAAHNASAAAAAAANFRGDWAPLAGELVRPACVKHAGRFWLLASDLANVATAEPGMHAAWVPMNVGAVPDQLISAAGTVYAVIGVRYVVAALNVRLIAPSTDLRRGDYHGVSVMSGITGFVWDFGTTNVRGAAFGARAWDLGARAIDLYFFDATRGYV